MQTFPKISIYIYIYENTLSWMLAVAAARGCLGSGESSSMLLYYGNHNQDPERPGFFLRPRLSLLRLIIRAVGPRASKQFPFFSEKGKFEMVRG